MKIEVFNFNSYDQFSVNWRLKQAKPSYIKHDLTNCIFNSEMAAYICNYRDHWFTIRRLGNQWFNLNSLLSGPELVSDTYLDMFLTQLQQEGTNYHTLLCNWFTPICLFHWFFKTTAIIYIWIQMKNIVCFKILRSYILVKRKEGIFNVWIKKFEQVASSLTKLTWYVLFIHLCESKRRYK